MSASPSYIVWDFNGEGAYRCEVLQAPCPRCAALALTQLPPPLLEQQPDETTHVCHPMLGGCNRGFSDSWGKK